MQIRIELRHHVIKAEGTALNNWTMVSVVRCGRPKLSPVVEQVEGDLITIDTKVLPILSSNCTAKVVLA